MPRFTYGLPGKNTPVVGDRPHASVMESPKKTTRCTSGAAGGSASLSARYRARSGQSCEPVFWAHRYPTHSKAPQIQRLLTFIVTGDTSGRLQTQVRA